MLSGRPSWQAYWPVPRHAPAEQEESLMEIDVDGKAVATIVIPDDPSQCVEYAAQELVYHLSESTGAA